MGDKVTTRLQQKKIDEERQVFESRAKLDRSPPPGNRNGAATSTTGINPQVPKEDTINTQEQVTEIQEEDREIQDQELIHDFED